MKSALLKGKIISCGMSVAEFCLKTNIKKNSIYRKLSGKTEFTRAEISEIIRVLNLSPDNVMEIFFD